MEIAELILAYIKVLIWPGVVISALFIFKNDIRKILSRIKKLTLPGGTELDVVKNYFELESNQNKFLQAEKEKEKILVDTVNKLQVDQKEKEKIINQLEEKNRRLKEAYTRINEIALSEMVDTPRMEILEECVNELSKENREFINFWFENPKLDKKEIAEKLNTSVNQVWIKKNRLIEKLNNCYQNKTAKL